MRIAALIAGILLGLVFLMASVTYFFHLYTPEKMPPAGSPPALFMGALVPTHFMDFVKSLELLGGLLVMIPRTRRLALLILGPIIVNILAFHIFVANGEGLANPMVLMLPVLALFLVWAERHAWGAFLRGR
ncbi:MAG: hypothetical protein H0X38_15690 [Planctomycetes bacterium]|nr:hypothetical protein [Planctomycetota bacterium]